MITFRIPETLPCLHDKVIAVATDVIASLSLNQKQVGVPGILGGIIKGLKAGKAEQDMDPAPNHDADDVVIEGLVIFDGPAPSSSIQKNKTEKKERCIHIPWHRESKLSQNSKELRSGAEDFASMAKELAKRLETRKWWQGTPVERSTMHILIT
ncbi:hypothetical protein C1H46_031087 [Malus baccata]|uniref:Uncharacterized protein n=1 Tax=Malus baccata TaxID=106549 RepID=A0A540LA72_MALBA|nr:hypothetical protein C1H46_031087 [Malus baccata]